MNGPVLIALHWLDEASASAYRTTLKELGYLPGIKFNRVMDIALGMRGLKRSDIYVTQTFHCIPQARSQGIA